MGKKKIRLIASDMDKTLLTTVGELPPDFHEWLEVLGEKGITFVAASGRPMVTLKKMFGNVVDRMVFISDNGGVIVAGGEVVFKSFASGADYRRILRYIREQIKDDYVPVLMCVDTCYIEKGDAKYEELLRDFLADITIVEDLLALEVEPPKVTIYCPRGNSHVVLKNYITPELLTDFSVVRGGKHWVDFTNPGVNKGKGLLRLGEHLDINPNEMMAFGDTENDLEMLKTVKYSYAVANADDDIKTVSSYQTATNDEYGVSQIIWQVIENNGQQR